jgi:TFIIF-interacting CTD phosphatase-like protein
MDETIVHTTFLETYQRVACRPYLDVFLDALHKDFDIVVWTAGTQAYADCLLDALDGKQRRITRRLYRPQCNLTPEGFYTKDMRRVARSDDPDLSRVCESCTGPTCLFFSSRFLHLTAPVSVDLFISLC